MKKLILLSLMLLLAIPCYANSVHVDWYEVKVDADAQNGGNVRRTYRIVVKELPKDCENWTIWFSMAWRKNFVLYERSTAQLIELEGNFYRIVPKPTGPNSPALSGNDSLFVEYSFTAKHTPKAWAPEGFSFQRGDEMPRYIPVNYHYLPMVDDTQRVASFQSKVKFKQPAIYDMIPALKSVKEVKDRAVPVAECDISNLKVIRVSERHPDGWYKLYIGGNKGVYAEAIDKSGELYAKVTLQRLVEASQNKMLPALEIEDYPDLAHRGLMLDPSRHFIPVWKLKEYMRLMTRYKLNVLHLRLSDDESWRLEISELAELAEVGGFHAVPTRNENGAYIEKEALQPAYDGTISRADTTRMANGYYSRKEFIELLHYADSLSIKVVPEIDLPGHSRSIIIAMEARNRNLGREEYQLLDPEDKSSYRSAQGYFRNTLDVARNDVYRLIDKIFDGIISIYTEANIPLNEIHIGGDEVPNGSWMGSPSCHRLLESRGFDIMRIKPWCSTPHNELTKEQRHARNEAKKILRSYFINRILDIAESKGIKVAGWHEMVGNIDQPSYERLCKHTAWVNYWRSSADAVHRIANDGFPVVISNASNTYADEAYSMNVEEFGNIWAGPVDEKRSFALLPYDMHRSIRWNYFDNDLDLKEAGQGKAPLNRPENVVGIQVQLFMGAAVRRYSDIDYMLFPKILGAFDRAWNTRPAWSSEPTDKELFQRAFNHHYSKIIAYEFPFYVRRGMRFHLPQPTIYVQNGKLYGETPIPNAEIRYEIGDKTPTPKSPVLKGKVSIPTNVSRVKARLFWNGEQSVSTVWCR